MTFNRRLQKLEKLNTKPSRLFPLTGVGREGREIVYVVGGRTVKRPDFKTYEAFWTDVELSEKEAWEADPNNPDPMGELFKYVAENNKPSNVAPKPS